MKNEAMTCGYCFKTHTAQNDDIMCLCTDCGGTAYLINFEEHANTEDIRCNTFLQFAHFVKVGGWQSVKAFEESTGVMHTELLSKWFTVTHDRVYINDEIGNTIKKVFENMK